MRTRSRTININSDFTAESSSHLASFKREGERGREKARVRLCNQSPLAPASNPLECHPAAGPFYTIHFLGERGAGGRFEAAAGLIEQRYTPCPEVQLRVRPLHGCLTYFNGASAQIWFGSRAGCFVALRGIIPEEVMIKHFADADDKDSKEPYSCVLIPLLPPFSLSLSPDV